MRVSVFRIFIILVTVLSLSVLFCEPVIAAQIRLGLEPDTEGDLAGYVIYYGTASRSYRWMVDVGNVTTYTLTGLTPGVTYFIAATAYDTSDNESDFSNEVSGMGRLVPPNIVLFQIDNGAANTGSRAVTLDNTTANGPTHHMASESSDFVGARWTRYSVKPKFTLSAGAGMKTVYFKAKGKEGESPVGIDTITLEGPSVDTFQINAGAANTGSRAVTLDHTAIHKPSHFMASESSDFVGARWTFYSVKPKLTLGAGAGTKTVYFKVKNTIGESPVVSDTITLEGPSVDTFQINAGAANTGSRTVTLDHTVLHKPSHFMASESSDFIEARWTFYSVKPRFTLSKGAGTKTVYFKVKNSIGESGVVSDTITLGE